MIKNAPKNYNQYIDLLKQLNFLTDEETNHWIYKDCDDKEYWMVDLTNYDEDGNPYWDPEIYNLYLIKGNNGVLLHDDINGVKIKNFDEFKYKLNDVVKIFKEFKIKSSMNKIENDFI